MAHAIIDIGSNTINLLVAEQRSGKFVVLEDRKIHAKLAKGGLNKGTIAPEAFARGLKALAELKEVCEAYHLMESDIVTYATASVRAASNGDEFVQRVLVSFGLKIKVIDGETEALLIHSGIKNGFPLNRDKVLVMDIGGGSVEFIITDQSSVHWKRSFYVGVTRLLDRFSPSDPPLASELEEVTQYVQTELTTLVSAIEEHRPVSLVGSSGSFDTIRAMIEAVNGQADHEKTWFKIEKKELRTLVQKLNGMTTLQREQVAGMDAMRAEYFPLAFVLILFLNKLMPEAEMFQCSYALKEGAFFYHFVK